jgi:hypothetical protein
MGRNRSITKKSHAKPQRPPCAKRYGRAQRKDEIEMVTKCPVGAGHR